MDVAWLLLLLLLLSTVVVALFLLLLPCDLVVDVVCFIDYIVVKYRRTNIIIFRMNIDDEGIFTKVYFFGF